MGTPDRVDEPGPALSLRQWLGPSETFFCMCADHVRRRRAIYTVLHVSTCLCVCIDYHRLVQ